jgi:hypothetical protein
MVLHEPMLRRFAKQRRAQKGLLRLMTISVRRALALSQFSPLPIKPISNQVSGHFTSSTMRVKMAWE